MKTLTHFARKPGAIARDCYDRIGGEPIGLTRENWPLFEGKPMVHLVTMSREHIVPALPAPVAAVAVFISSLMDNEAGEPRTKHSKVVFLTKADVARGTTTAEEVFGQPVENPRAEAALLVAERAEYAPEQVDLYEETRKPVQDCAGGGLSAEDVAWAQHGDDLPEGHRVLFWFNETLVPEVNFGDMGWMYVTASPDAQDSTAWYQQ